MVKDYPYIYKAIIINCAGEKTHNFSYVGAFEYHEIGSYVVIQLDEYAIGETAVVTQRMMPFTKTEGEIACEIDLDNYIDRVKRRKEYEKVHRKLDKLINSIKEEDILKMYAEKNPEVAELYSKLKELED
jgi:hypothetical protein